MNRNIIIAFLVFVAVVAAGVFTIKKPVIRNTNTNSGQTLQTPGGSSADSKEIEIVANEYSFTPSSIVVQKGDRVSIILKNAGAITHALFIDGYGLTTGNVLPGRSATLNFTADKTGLFNYYCNIDGHKDLGMQGELEVK